MRPVEYDSVFRFYEYSAVMFRMFRIRLVSELGNNFMIMTAGLFIFTQSSQLPVFSQSLHGAYINAGYYIHMCSDRKKQYVQ